MNIDLDSLTPEEFERIRVLANEKKKEYNREWNKKNPGKNQMYQERCRMRKVLREIESQKNEE